MAFFRHPQRNRLDDETFVRCFFENQCPQVGVLGDLLGKSREEPRDLESFCPNIEDEEMLSAVTAPEDVEGLRDMYRRLVVNALNKDGRGDSCTDWARRERRLLSAQPAPAAMVADALPLTWYEIRSGGYVAAADILLGETPARAMVDTGGSGSSLHMTDEALRARADIETTGVSQRAKGIYRIKESTVARIGALRIGSNLRRQARFDIETPRYPGFGWLDHPRVVDALIGMTELLRYSAVCFAWEERRLYLGELGPCGAGAHAYDAHLHGSLMIRIPVPAADGSTYPATLDTGAVRTHCSRVFLKANGGDPQFAFGDHPALRGVCTFDAGVLFPYPEHGTPQVVVRMNTLLRFRAFGWQRHPMKVFFVPGADAGSGEQVAPAGA